MDSFSLYTPDGEIKVFAALMNKKEINIAATNSGIYTFRVLGSLHQSVYDALADMRRFNVTPQAVYLAPKQWDELRDYFSRPSPIEPTAAPTRPSCTACRTELSSYLDAYYGTDAEQAGRCARCRR